MLTLETFVAAAVEKSDGEGDKKPGDSKTDLPDGPVAINEYSHHNQEQCHQSIV